MSFLKKYFHQTPIAIDQDDLASHWSPPITVRKMSAQHTADFFNPIPQPFYTFHQGSWLKSGSWQESGTSNPCPTVLPPIKLLSWNIDFQVPASQARMKRALEHLHHLISALPASTPPIVLLQEMTSSDLSIIQSTPWIRQTFHITDLSAQNWLSHYGTCTLISHLLPLTSVFRVRYTSNMDRDALFVDIEGPNSSSVLRICNTHLESLVAEPPLRPAQVKLLARYLKDPTVDAGVVAGDFNAIEEFDEGLHGENGLRDAYLEGGGREGKEEGWTWGMQSLYEGPRRFPNRRMDKVLFCGKARVNGLERFGGGVRIEEGLGKGQFVTDHLGLMADVVMVVDND